MTRIHVFFRTCDVVTSLHGAPRPFGADKRTLLRSCFRSVRAALGTHAHRIVIVGDRLTPDTEAFFRRHPVEVLNRELDNDRSLALCIEQALECPDDDWVYFCEDDYLHRPEAFDVIARLVHDRERILSAPRGPQGDPARRPLYIHPPDYPDRYKPRYRRPSWIFVSPDCHWREVDSMTFTFLAETRTLRQHARLLRESARGARDRHLSRGLFAHRLLGTPALCLSPMPGLATHLHDPVMTPLVDWEPLFERYSREVEAG